MSIHVNAPISFTLPQVSTKESELGVGQTTFMDQTFELVDFSPAMYMSERFIASKKPTEVMSYDTIIIPYDKYVWLCTCGCICTQFLLLIAMQYLYSHVTETRNPNDFIYEGTYYRNLQNSWH